MNKEKRFLEYKYFDSSAAFLLWQQECGAELVTVTPVVDTSCSNGTQTFHPSEIEESTSVDSYFKYKVFVCYYSVAKDLLDEEM